MRNSPTAAAGVPHPANTQAAGSIAGIPMNELTPRVRAAMMKLVTEVDDLRRELQDQRVRMSRLESEADRDVLLPCLNRRAFVREMSRLLSFVERYGAPASLLYIDLDDFKSINDRHGHPAGDMALQRACAVLAGNIRESDVLGRIGGDEFGIILAKANQREADAKAEMLAELIKASPIVWEGRAIHLAFTTGAYEFRPGEKPAEIIARADRAMYDRKARRAAAAG